MLIVYFGLASPDANVIFSDRRSEKELELEPLGYFCKNLSGGSLMNVAQMIELSCR